MKPLCRSLCLGVALTTLAVLWPLAAAERLTSRSRSEMPTQLLSVGDKLTTEVGERQRVLLPDRSVLFVRERTTLEVKAANKLHLSQGEVFIEAPVGKLTPALEVQTPKRTMRARDSRFGVRAGEGGTLVLVATGNVQVDEVKLPIRGGQVLSEKATTPVMAPRMSHLVAWTRELRNAAPLVPNSVHAGGTLVARTPEGQEAKLELRKFTVDVHIEDGFARTTIDQTFFNDTMERLEGTFHFPLPADASLSRLAMYVDGNLMEGGMAERDHARSVFERIVWEKRDPALLEWVDGSTFKLRVFPLEARQEKRLLLSYTQKLSSSYGRMNYRFPAGHSLNKVGQWSLNVRVKDGSGLAWQSDSHTLNKVVDKNDLLLSASLKNATLDRDVVLQVGNESKADEQTLFATTEHDGAKYLLVRHRPSLTTEAVSERRDWVFLVESSGDRDPLLMRSQIELVRSMLSNANREDTFSIVTASTRCVKHQDKPLTNDLANIEEAMVRLEKVHLVGAFDMGRALTELQPMLDGVKNPWLVHVGSGIAAMGESRTAELGKRLPKGVRYVGVGVDKRWNRSMMQTLAENTSGYFTQVNPDEVIDWRGMEVLSALNAPRLLDASVSAETVQFLNFGKSVNQGEELVALCRVEKELPAKIKISGTVDGKAYEREIEVKDARESVGYLPRSWAKLEIERLLAENAAKHKKRITELSMAMYVMTPFTSLLVLETEEMYKQYKVDRGRKDHWAMYPAPGKIPVVVEPIEGIGDPRKGLKPTAKIVRQSIVERTTPRVLNVATYPQGEEDEKVFDSWSVALRAVRPLGESRERLKRGTTPAPEAFHRQELYLLQNGRFSGTNDPLWRDGSVNSLTVSDASDKRLTYNIDRIQDVAVDGVAVDGELSPEMGLQNSPMFRKKLASARVGQIVIAGREHKQEPILRLLDNASRGYLSDGLAVRSSLLYSRPSYTNNDQLFYDLLAYAPGLNTNDADTQAVYDAEARPATVRKTGTVADAAKRFFDASAKAGWRSLKVAAQGRTPAFTVTFDGTGRYHWKRTLASGLQEEVICDGKTLWHMYPTLGLAAKRPVSKHHRMAFSDDVPWCLPRTSDYTNGNDVVSLSENLIAVVPHKSKSNLNVQMHLAFDDAGTLKERRWLLMPNKILLRREVVTDTITETTEPNLTPDVKKLVVVEMPWRTPAHVLAQPEFKDLATDRYTFEQATRVMCAHMARGDSNAAAGIFTQALARREQRQLGYFVLLAAAGVTLESGDLDVLEAHPHEPLAMYLSLYSSTTLRRHASRWAAASTTWSDPFLQQLALGHMMCQRWSAARNLGTPTQRNAERKRALDYVQKYAGSPLAWALLGLVQDRTREDKDSNANKAIWAELAKSYAMFEKSTMDPVARYEQARCQWKAGELSQARKQFVALYEEALKQGGLLPIDADFRATLVGGESNAWSALMRRSVKTLLSENDRVGALALARQCYQLDDAALARQLFDLTLEDVKVEGSEGLKLYRLGINLLEQMGQTDEADRLTQKLLADKEHAKRADLWRLDAKLASNRSMGDRELSSLEKALSLEYEQLPDVLNLENIRKDYRELLNAYSDLAKALTILKTKPPAGFRDRVIQAADRWRALDRDQDSACDTVAAVLRRLGERELAWDYLTTPIALQPGESQVWLNLASRLVLQNERDLADRAFQSAFERESTNPQILWDRAENLRRAGRADAARKLYRQIAESDWQPRFATLKEQARWRTE